MRYVERSVGICALVLVLACGSAFAADYRLVPASPDVEAGETISLTVEVVTQSGDNLVGSGHFAFAIDLSFNGTAEVGPDAISALLLNQTVFSDVESGFLGTIDGSQLKGVGGASLDAFGPNAGASVGDIVQLFSFSLSVPAAAPLGSTITITPSEGRLQNVTVNDMLDRVSPQTFSSTNLVVIPEPASLVLLAAASLLARRRRRAARD